MVPRLWKDTYGAHVVKGFPSFLEFPVMDATDNEVREQHSVCESRVWKVKVRALLNSYRGHDYTNPVVCLPLAPPVAHQKLRPNALLEYSFASMNHRMPDREQRLHTHHSSRQARITAIECAYHSVPWIPTLDEPQHNSLD